jgi:stage III sporulation protein AB
MQKLLGIILILFSAAGLGFGQGRLLTGQLKAREKLLQLTILLKGEIRYGNITLADAFLQVSRNFPDAYGTFLKELARELQETRGCSFFTVFAECAAGHFEDMGLQKEEQELLLFLGEHLGCTDQEMQMRQLTFCEEELQRKTEEFRRELPDKKKVSQSLGILGGILLAVFVW